MCGLTGYYSFAGRPLEAGRIQAMVRTLRHRGPDDEGVYELDAISLGHTRLAIIDLSVAGHQPMTNETKDIWLVFNGEIYNYETIRRDLLIKGHTFKSNTDSETIIHLYEEIGDDFLTKLNGMFAIALWDSKRQKLILARDRAGEKPLFYHQGPDYIVFGSEVKAILASGLVQRQIDSRALSSCLVYNAMPAPYTIFSDVRQLLPGQALFLENERISPRRYWTLIDAVNKTSTNNNERQWLEGFASLFERSVTMRMRSDAPYGAFLSGGLDSSAVVKVMSDVARQPIRSFAFGFEESEFDETDYASFVAGVYHTNHEAIFTSEAELPALIERVVYHSEEYTPNPCFIPVYLLCRGASKHVKMVLSGDGGDEVLAGYETYQATHLAQLYQKLPRWMQSILEFAISRLPISQGKVPLEDKLKRFVYGARRPGSHAHALWRYIFTLEEARDVLTAAYSRDVEEWDPASIYTACLDEGKPLSLLGSLLYADFSYYMPNDALVRMDRMGMANGLEIRSPFIDHQLVEYAFSMPDSLRLRRFSIKKYALREYLKDSLPRRIVNRKKAGFNVPADAWLRGPLKEYLLDRLSSREVESVGVFRRHSVERLITEHMERKANHGLRLWNLLCFHIWWGLFQRPLSVTDQNHFLQKRDHPRELPVV